MRNHTPITRRLVSGVVARNRARCRRKQASVTSGSGAGQGLVTSGSGAGQGLEPTNRLHHSNTVDQPHPRQHHTNTVDQPHVARNRGAV